MQEQVSGGVVKMTEGELKKYVTDIERKKGDFARNMKMDQGEESICQRDGNRREDCERKM